MPNQVRVGVGVTGAKAASSDMDKLRDRIDKLQKQTGKGLLTGFAAGVGLGAIGLATTAVSEFTSVIGDSIKAAQEDEVSIQRLTTSLKANIPAWDGNTKAIEGVIKARMALGFTDEDQRNSLAKTVAATHDVSKALAIQSTAMDLARFKGISLADATDALTKVEAGSYRILKSLGIQLPKNATQTEALAAVQKVAAGQAEAYAKTNEGKLLVSQVKVGEAMERVGYISLPLVASATSIAADKVTELSDDLGALQDALGAVSDAGKSFGIDMGGVGVDLSILWTGLPQLIGNGIGLLTKPFQHAAAATQAAGHDMDRSLNVGRTSLGLTGDAAADLAKRTEDMQKRMSNASNRVTTSFGDMRDSIVGDAQSIVNDAYAVIDETAALSADKAKESAAERVVASKTATDAEKRDAKSALHDVTRDQIAQVLALTKSGDTSSKTFTQAYNDLKNKLKTATGQERVAIQAAIDAVLRLNAVVRAGIPNLHLMQSIEKSIAHHIPSQSGGGGYQKNIPTASGGPRKKGDTLLVGEQGPEIMELGGDAFFTPADMSARAMGGRGSAYGGSMTLNLTVNAGIGVTPAHAQELGNSIGPIVAKWMQGNGLLPRSASPQR